MKLIAAFFTLILAIPGLIFLAITPFFGFFMFMPLIAAWALLTNSYNFWRSCNEPTVKVTVSTINNNPTSLFELSDEADEADNA